MLIGVRTREVGSGGRVVCWLRINDDNLSAEPLVACGSSYMQAESILRRKLAQAGLPEGSSLSFREVSNYVFFASGPPGYTSPTTSGTSP